MITLPVQTTEYIASQADIPATFIIGRVIHYLFLFDEYEKGWSEKNDAWYCVAFAVANVCHGWTFDAKHLKALDDWYKLIRKCGSARAKAFIKQHQMDEARKAVA